MEGRAVTFGFWQQRGNHEQVRLLLEYLGVPYIERSYINMDDWIRESLSLNTPFPALPYIKDGDRTICNADAIITYLCLKCNRPELLGKNPKQIVAYAQIRSILDDCYDALLRTRNPDDRRRAIAERVVLRLDQITKFISGDGKATEVLNVLNDLTALDFKLYALLDMYRGEDPNSKLHPALGQFLYKMESLPAIADYRRRNTPQFQPLQQAGSGFPPPGQQPMPAKLT